ncbi:SRPBCC family protein [Lacisediminihabitans sp.]|jgi:carbon monoxide dehydrogenase subunit G|uniref:SRPBCC family protein n=1 Tax=Lacisediminihabitans sp. TaxID=2787631 RepID=UPI002F940BD7
MQLDSTFSVVAPIDTVWNTLMDFERVAGCVPGAQILNKLSEDAYQVGMKVKLGPVSMQYRGQMNVIERDADGHRAVFQGKAQETRGQGTAVATVTLQLVESKGTTEGTVSADVSLSGKAAAMGKGVITSVTDQMMALFAENLQTMVGEPTPAAATAAADSAADSDTSVSGTAASRTAASRTAASGTAASGTAASAPAPAAPRAPSALADNSLNAFSLAKGMIADQLKDPAKLIGALAAVASIAFLLGRLSRGRRS